MIQPILYRLGTRRPYFHLTGYMNRYWLLGAASNERNRDNPDWTVSDWEYADSRSRLYQWLTRHLAIRLHHILRSDNDRHLHDHPCWNVSVVLKGGYFEIMPMVQKNPAVFVEGDQELTFKVWRGPGSIVFRRASARHKIVLPPGQTCWSIFILGRKSQPWGFYTPTGKVGWREYLGLCAQP